MSRICMVVPGTPPTIDKLLRQLNKLVYVEHVTDLTVQPFVNRELMLVKVGGVGCDCNDVPLQVACVHNGGRYSISRCTQQVVRLYLHPGHLWLHRS